MKCSVTSVTLGVLFVRMRATSPAANDGRAMHAPTIAAVIRLDTSLFGWSA